MTAKELLELLRKETQGYAGTAVMDEKEFQRLMEKPSAIFIRYPKPEKDQEEKKQKPK